MFVLGLGGKKFSEFDINPSLQKWEEEKFTKMGQKREEYAHHPAADNLVTLFTKANHDLSLLHFKLDKEFQQIYPDNVIPLFSLSSVSDLSFI